MSIAIGVGNEACSETRVVPENRRGILAAEQAISVHVGPRRIVGTAVKLGAGAIEEIIDEEGVPLQNEGRVLPPRRTVA